MLLSYQSVFCYRGPSQELRRVEEKDKLSLLQSRADWSSMHTCRCVPCTREYLRRVILDQVQGPPKEKQRDWNEILMVSSYSWGPRKKQATSLNEEAFALIRVKSKPWLSGCSIWRRPFEGIQERTSFDTCKGELQHSCWKGLPALASLPSSRCSNLLGCWPLERGRNKLWRRRRSMGWIKRKVSLCS